MKPKIAFFFPGQGSQKVGMGKDFFERFEEAREVFEAADRALGFKISELCFQGPEEELKKTENTQPAILTTSIAILRVLEKYGLKADMAAGHSLGEYSALVAAGSLAFEDAVRTVRERGKLMVKAVPYGQGTMAAVLLLDREIIEKVCNETPGVVEPANYNNATETVISGEVAAVRAAADKLRQLGAKKVVELNVSGPFHSSLLKPASEGLAEVLKDVIFETPQFSVYSNYTGDISFQPIEIRENLIDQVSHSVKWQDSVEKMIRTNVDLFIEIGPGSTLKNMLKRIDRQAKAYSVNSVEALETLQTKGIITQTVVV